MTVGALRIGALEVDPPLFLAPMAGVTDRDFRLILRRIGGVGVVAMEFLPSRGMVSGDEYVERRLAFVDEERPLAIQIYGSDAPTMAAAAERVEALGADLCDVNMGCPANKVLRGCAGAALMGDLPLARRIVAAARRRLRIPLTVKFRLGLDEHRESFLELGRICEGEGSDAVALHPRTARQGFRGAPRWAAIAELKEALAIPVIGNGDVATPDDAVRMLRETGCDGVMVGRGATRNPWIFRQIAARLALERSTAEPTTAEPTTAEPTMGERRELILSHFRTVVEREDEHFALHKLRLFTRWYSHGLPNGQRLRRRIQELGDAEGFFVAVEHFFADADALRAATCWETVGH